MAHKYLINKGSESEREVEADWYDYSADNELITFWTSGGAGRRDIAVLTLRLVNVKAVDWVRP